MKFSFNSKLFGKGPSRLRATSTTLIAVFLNFFQDRIRCDPEAWACLERNLHNNFSCAVTCEGIYADVELEEERREDMEKVSKLIGQYNDLKRKRLPNFRFNPEKGTMPFGKKKHSYLNVFHDFDFEFD